MIWKTEDSSNVLTLFKKILDLGHTYEELRNNILYCLSHKQKLNLNSYSKKPIGFDSNLLKSNQRYYHKELKIMSGCAVVNHDIDSGTITSKHEEYYMEPVASYTINEIVEYLYSKDVIDRNEFSDKRVKGLIKYLVEKYDVDKTLFLIESACRKKEETHQYVNLANFDSLNLTAQTFIEDIKNNSRFYGGDKIVCRRRMLPR